MWRGEGVRGILRLELLRGCADSSSYAGAAAGPAEGFGQGFGSRPSGLRPPPPGLPLLDGLRRWLRQGCLGRQLQCWCWLSVRTRSQGILCCLSRFLFFEERGFESSPRPREGRKFMPFPHSEGETLGLNDGSTDLKAYFNSIEDCLFMAD